MKSRWFWVVLIIIIVFCLCLSCLGIGIGSFLLISEQTSSISETLEVPPFVIEPSESDPTDDPHFEDNTAPEFQNDQPEPSEVNPASKGAIETLETLSNTIVPNNDPIELAERLLGITNIPDTVPDKTNYAVGDTKQFWGNQCGHQRKFQYHRRIRIRNRSRLFLDRTRCEIPPR